MRIDSLTYNNIQTQGEKRRVWLRQHSAHHLEQCKALIMHALQQREPSASRSTVVLGAGACTEVPLGDLARASDEVVLVDIDRASMQKGRAELSSAGLRKRVRLLESDLTGGVSANLHYLIERKPWEVLVPQGGEAVFAAAAHCIEECQVPDPPQISGLGTHDFGVVISSLVLSQLFSYPLLDVLDLVQRIAPGLLEEQERHSRYQKATQAFRVRVLQAHLHLLRELVDTGGRVVLLSDMRGFIFEEHDAENTIAQRRTMPLVPRTLPELVRAAFPVQEEAHWEWLTDLPEQDKFGRGYEVVGYVLG